MPFLTSFFAIFIKFFFLLIPFFTLTVFLAITEKQDELFRRRLAKRVTTVCVILCAVFFFAGQMILNTMGIDLNAFRVGGGVLLMLVSVALTQGSLDVTPSPGESPEDIAVVPLAIPTILGPACLSYIMVCGSEPTSIVAADSGLTMTQARAIGFSALVSALLLQWLIFHFGTVIARLLGLRTLRILSKLSGIVLAALAAQMMFVGLANLFFNRPEVKAWMQGHP